VVNDRSQHISHGGDLEYVRLYPSKRKDEGYVLWGKKTPMCVPCSVVG